MHLLTCFGNSAVARRDKQNQALRPVGCDIAFLLATRHIRLPRAIPSAWKRQSSAKPWISLL